jgi:hypothetical protein
VQTAAPVLQSSHIARHLPCGGNNLKSRMQAKSKKRDENITLS